MSLILHLSDLHLGTKDPPFDDAKTESVPKPERETRQKTIRRTLRKLGRYLKSSGEPLDAIFVTGDITYANDEKGFHDFQSVLDELGDRCPAKSRIVVLPGNHDVSRGTAPSCSARYELFNKYVRTRRFVTPLLDGIDISATSALPANLNSHYILDTRNKWLVIPVNSSNYCQMIEPITPIPEAEWIKFQNDLNRFGEKAVAKALGNLRLNDAARISPDQFDALEELLNKIAETISSRGDDPASYLRIAVLHHHLLPVTTVEEIKKFESFTNLGLLRYFLAKHKFDLVLHGHKHIAKRYWDFIPFATEQDLLPHRLLVISGGTLGETYDAEDEICRLIRIGSEENARTLSVASVRGLVAGDRFDELAFESIPFWEPSLEEERHATPLQRIVGKDVNAVYNRVLAAFEDLSTEKHRYNLVCQVSDGSTAKNIPKRYPDVNTLPANKKQQWFKKLVDWWQLDQPTLSKTLHFTHGNRIYRDVDQIENVVALLSKRPHSSRAVVTLCRPQTDSVHEHKKKFPSFCLAQFLVRERDGNSPVLDCVGYFRKQEMKYWWPVNVAELAELQNKVYDGIPKVDGLEHLQLGSITTFASIARVGKRPPQVTVPIVDRNLDQDRQLLWNMSYALFWPEIPNRDCYCSEWEKVFTELVPAGGFDPDGVPVPLKGLKFLLSHIEQFALHHPGIHVQRLVKAMKELHERNEEFADTLYKDEDEARQKYHNWQQRTAKLVEEMRKAVRKILDG